MKKILIAIVVGLAFASCTKTLDMPDDGRFDLKKIFSDFNLSKGYLNKCYNYMPGGGIIGDYAMYYDGTLLASYCDEAQDSRDVQKGNIQNWYTGNATASSFPIVDYWSLYYQGIRTCNTFLKEIETAPFREGNSLYDGEVKVWKANVFALRAFYFLQIIKRYGPAPILTEPMSSDSDFSGVEKASFTDCAKAVIADCEQAITLGLPWKIGTAADTDYGRMSRAVVYAIQSQAALYAASDLWNEDKIAEERTAKWKWAAGITGTALEQCIANGYELFAEVPEDMLKISSSSAYQTYFLTKMDILRNKDKETIYECKSQLAVWRDAGLPISTNTIRSGSCPTQELVDAYEMAETGLSPFQVDEDGCVIYDDLTPRVNAVSGYDPADPYKGRDPRFKATVYYNASLYNFEDPATGIEIYKGGSCAVSSTDQRHTRTGYYLRKFHHNLSNVSNQADGYMKVFRLAELYLNFAEAANEAYGPTGNVATQESALNNAMKAVNAVRDRAGMPHFDAKGSLSKEEFRKKYRNERRVELAFEQHRFYDVRRWKILSKTDKQITGMNPVRSVDESDPENPVVSYDYTSARFKVAVRMSAEDKYLRFPIKPSEVSKMEMYTGEVWQNPGW